MKNHDTVRLTETAKLTPFWRSDPFRNATGTVIGQPLRDGSLTVRMVKNGGGIPKVFYINPANLILVLPASDKPKAPTRAQAIEALKLRGVCMNWFKMSCRMQLDAVVGAPRGSEWINVMSGKTVKVQSASCWGGVRFITEQGRLFTKGANYFVYDYCPNIQAPSKGGLVGGGPARFVV